MTKLNEFRELSINITWGLIQLGYNSATSFSGELDREDIIEFAINCFSNNPNDDLVLNLIIEEDTEKIGKILYRLAERENINHELERRKWMVILLNRVVKKKNTNYIDGLIELSEVRQYFDNLYDIPIDLQGVNNYIPPYEYYTQENYDNQFTQCKEWIRKQLTVIYNAQ